VQHACDRDAYRVQNGEPGEKKPLRGSQRFLLMAPCLPLQQVHAAAVFYFLMLNFFGMSVKRMQCFVNWDNGRA
jgi:hypothetical protein